MGTRGEERLKAITDAATEVVAERGYYGMTIQEVSDRVGITQAGLLKYVKNKNGLLMLVLRRYEDSSEAGDYIQSKLALTPEQRELSPLLMPEYYRTIAEDTMKRPQLTQLAMEGLQSRWLGEPDIDFMSSWSQYENILFPRPHWNGYR